MDDTEGLVLEEPLLAAVRYVRTNAGSQRFGVPIGSKIETDANGNVISLNGKPVPQSTSGRTNAKAAGSAAFAPVDPNRTPTKFVPTVPGQVAKLGPVTQPITTIGVKPPAPIKTATKKGTATKAPSSSSGAVSQSHADANGLNRNEAAAVNQPDMFAKHVGGNLTSEERAAIAKAGSGQPMNAQEKQALMLLIGDVLDDFNKKSANSQSTGSKKNAPQTAAQKAAASAAAKKSAATRKKNGGTFFTPAQWRTALEETLRSMGGEPPQRAKPGSGSYATTNQTVKSPNYLGSKKNKVVDYNNMTDAQLEGAIRGLANSVINGGGPAAQSALRRAQAERDARTKNRQAAIKAGTYTG